MNKNQFVKDLRSPWSCIGRWLETDTDFANRFEYLNDIDKHKYDWYQMRPKVTYDDWIVCLYQKDNKLYRIDLEDLVICEVDVVNIVQYDDQNRFIDANGDVIADDNLHNHHDSTCCGESDDLSCFIYFNDVKI